MALFPYFHSIVRFVFHFRKYHTFRPGKQEQKKIRRNCDGQSFGG